MQKSLFLHILVGAILFIGITRVFGDKENGSKNSKNHPKGRSDFDEDFAADADEAIV